MCFGYVTDKMIKRTFKNKYLFKPHALIRIRSLKLLNIIIAITIQVSKSITKNGILQIYFTIFFKFML